MAQHGNTSSQRFGIVGRIVDGWQDVKYAQHRVGSKNTPWLVSPSTNHVRRSDV